MSTRLERRKLHGRDLGARVGGGTAAVQEFRSFPRLGRHRHRGVGLLQSGRDRATRRRRGGRRCRPGGACAIPIPGEVVSGDAWAVRSDEAGRTMMVVDGLGHGPEAAKVAAEATRLFDKYWRSGPMETLQALHAGLRATRGGAVARRASGVVASSCPLCRRRQHCRCDRNDRCTLAANDLVQRHNRAYRSEHSGAGLSAGASR